MDFQKANENKDQQEVGKIKLSEEVIATIAGIAATDVDGVAEMSGGIAGELADILRRKNFSKGVKVELGEKEVAIDLYVVVKYGYRIPEVSWEIQERVKNDVEAMSGLRVVEVNIHVQSIKLDEEHKDELHDIE